MDLRLTACAGLFLTACIADAPASRAITLHDPLGLIDNVYASGNALELYVLPADAHACTASTGGLTPPLPSIGPVPDAIVDLRLARDELARREVTVPAGHYTVYARGRGTDAESGETNATIVQACADTDIAGGATVSVALTLVPVLGMGVCGNGVLSPDEQCELPSPECSNECRTMQEALNTTTALPQNRVRVAAATGKGVIAVWDSDASSIGVRLFDRDARALRGLGPLQNDFALDDLSRPEGLPGVQTSGAAAVAADGRIAIAFVDFGTGSPNIRVGFFSDTLSRVGTYRTPHSAEVATRANPALAFHSSMQLLVAFEDSASATGLIASVFLSDGTLSAELPVSVGDVGTGARSPSVAAMPGGFVVAFETSTGVFYQRFDMNGAALDANAQAVDGTSNRRFRPSVAARPDGRFVIAWTESGALSDPMGTGIRACVFAPNGEPSTESFAVNELVMGDQDDPTVAASDERFVIAWQSDESIRARVFSDEGTPLLHRERPPGLGDFEVAPVGARPSAALIGGGADRAWWIAYEAPGDALDVFARRFAL